MKEKKADKNKHDRQDEKQKKVLENLKFEVGQECGIPSKPNNKLD